MSQQAQTGRDTTQVSNDPKTMNILAWFMGGSLLMSGVASVYYTRTRVKQNAKTHSFS